MTSMPHVLYAVEKKIRDDAGTLGGRIDTAGFAREERKVRDEGLRGIKLDVARASARNVVARAQFLNSTLSARETAELLGLAAVRRCSAAGALLRDGATPGGNPSAGNRRVLHIGEYGTGGRRAALHSGAVARQGREPRPVARQKAALELVV